MLSSLAVALGLFNLAHAQGAPPTNDGIPPLASLRFNYTNLVSFLHRDVRCWRRRRRRRRPLQPRLTKLCQALPS